MNTSNLKLSIALGLVLANNAFAIDPEKEKEEFDLNSIVEIEEDIEFDLGFDTREYLPEDFNPYAFPTDVEGINFIDPRDDFEVDFDTTQYLPEGFDPYKKAK
ncbi:hypothetical protein FK220_018945 [Flavobacteriaceae bacterium TP-CH-4]|uniref:Uncharacterized protein n=1 Tax=Pelagihabitans pacificus TaxID=2696054 RepID=A0A967AYC9_9FLAO|nr:hypothetical protein [Pelagihabitans pacificus]NHF61438.1 hypothetical protein [Pelagihabitans pacificus]